MRKILVLIIAAILLMPLHAEERFYQAIVNASYLSDFAFGAFPLSLWGDFGVTGVEVIPGMHSQIYSTMKAGLTERSVMQDPVSGNLLENGGGGYSVVFSDGTIVLKQELMKKPALSAEIAGRMRWEQAFATLRDIRDEKYGGIFETDLFPAGGNTFLKGTPELSGDKYFMAASIQLGLDYSGYWKDWYGDNAYGVSMDFELAPSWFLNDLWFIDEVFTDAGTINIGAYWNIGFADAKTASGRTRFSLYMSNSISAGFLFGESIPRFMLDRSFMGKFVIPRNFHFRYKSYLEFKGPEFFIEGTYPRIYIYAENAINTGKTLNTVNSTGGVEFYGGIGCGANLYVMKYFDFFAELKYVYAGRVPSDKGLSFSMGAYVNLFV